MRHKWTPEQEETIRQNRHLSAPQMKAAKFSHVLTITETSLANKMARVIGLMDFPRSAEPWSEEEETYLKEKLDIDKYPNAVIQTVIKRHGKDIDQMRWNIYHGKVRQAPRAPRVVIAKAIPVKKQVLRSTRGRNGAQKNAATDTPIKRSAVDAVDKGEQLLQLALEILKSADPDLMEKIRARRRQKDDNPELVALWDYLCLPQAKDLPSSNSARILCRRLRVATEHHNRLLRNLAPEKSANVSTFQYNQIRHICGIRITSFTDHKIHGNLTLELTALTNAVEDVKNNVTY